MMAVCTATWVARHSAGRLATELITPTAGLAKPSTPPGALTCTLPRWLTGSQRWSLKCSSEHTAIRAEDSASPTAPLRTTSDGAGRGMSLLAAPRSGSARPTAVARTIIQTRYSTATQVQSLRCANIDFARPEFTGFPSAAVYSVGFSYP